MRLEARSVADKSLSAAAYRLKSMQLDYAEIAREVVGAVYM